MAEYQPQSTFYLIKDVDIDSSYNHQYLFHNVSDRDAFFQSKIFVTVENGTYQRKNAGVVDVPFLSDFIASCKYMMWQNPEVSTRWYYAFINRVDYVNPSMSTVYYELDVYQTYLYDMEWQPSFIERQHEPLYNQDGTPVINLIDEGLDYGSTYRILKKTNLVQFPDVSFAVMGFTERITEYQTVNGGSFGSVPTQLFYYILPINVNTTTSWQFTYNNSDSTSDSTLLTEINTFLGACVNDQNFVGKMVSCVIYPFLTLKNLGHYMANSSVSRKNFYTDSLIRSRVKWTTSGSMYLLEPVTGNFFTALEPYEVTDPHTIYQDFPQYEESKLLMYPYSFTELTDERGDSMVLRNELINGGKGSIHVGIYGTVNYVNQMSFLIRDYGGASGYYFENGIHDTSNASLPIIDEYTASYLQSNSNSIEVARSNALASRNTSLSNADTSYSARNDQIGWNLMASNVRHGSNLIGAGVDLMFNPSVQNVGHSLSRGISALGDIGAGYLQSKGQKAVNNADLSVSYASANVNYQNTIATIQAKYQDAQQIPSNMRSAGSDILFGMSYFTDGIYLLKKTIQPKDADRLSDYFKQFGYKVNRLEQPNFYTRQRWNYIKMAQPNVFGNIPMDDLMKIRDIFMHGITLWHGDYVGQYNLANPEV